MSPLRKEGEHSGTFQCKDNLTAKWIKNKHLSPLPGAGCLNKYKCIEGGIIQFNAPLSYSSVTAPIADVRSSFSTNYELKLINAVLVQSGGALNKHPSTSELLDWIRVSTHLKQGSDFILLQIRLNSWLLRRRHEETNVPRQELLAGWNHGVSRCHSSFTGASRRL